MSTILKKRGRDRLTIMQEVLAIAEEGDCGKSQIMYKANLSYNSVTEYLILLLELNLLKKVRKGKRMFYQLTGKGREYLHSIREIKRLLYKTETKSEKALDYRPINHMDLRFEVKNLKTRVERLEKFVPKLEFCPNCRKEIRPDFRLCPYCGKKLLSRKIKVRQT